MKRIDNVWTQENTLLLIKLWGEKVLTGQQIADQLKTTRSAVLGKVRRMKLPYRTEEEKKPRHNKAEPVRKFKKSNLPIEPKAPGASRRKKRIEHHIVDDPSKNVTLMQLKEKSCRYPLDNHMFCGQVAQENSSYCPGHHSLCTIPVQSYRRRQLDADVNNTPWKHWKPVK